MAKKVKKARRTAAKKKTRLVRRVTTPADVQTVKEEPQGVQSAEKTEVPEEKEGPGTIGDIMKDEGLIEEPDESAMGKQKAPELSEIVMRIDRIDGKMELFKGMLDSFNERALDLNEKLGDTRRIVFEREKSSSKLDTEFEKVSTIVKELDPEKIVLMFEKFKTDIATQNAKVERINELISNIGERTKDVEDKISKIKSFENLVNASQLVEEKMGEIEETKKYSDKNAAKVESMFLEINDKVTFMRKNIDKIDKTELLLQEVTKDIDKIKFQIDQELIRKKQMDALLDSVKDVIIEEVVGINPVAFDNLRRRVTLIENEGKNPNDLNEERKKLGILEEQVERDYQMGRLKQESYDEIKKSIAKKMDEIEVIFQIKQGAKKKEVPSGKRGIFGLGEKKQENEEPAENESAESGVKTPGNETETQPVEENQEVQNENKSQRKRREKRKEKKGDHTLMKSKLLDEAKRERKK